MSKTTKILGKLPINRGDYSPTADYFKDNLVQYNKATFICTVDKLDTTNPNHTPKDYEGKTPWKRFAGYAVEQTFGDNENAVLSQKATTELIGSMITPGSITFNKEKGKLIATYPKGLRTELIGESKIDSKTGMIKMVYKYN